MLSRHDIQDHALRWVGTRWKHQGRSVNGVDCAGLVVMIAHEVDYPVVDRKAYSRRASGFDFVEEVRTSFDERPDVTLRNTRPGDILLFRDSYYPCHCGIVVSLHGNNYIVHSHAFHRKVIIDTFSSTWIRKWCNTFEFRGIE